MKKILTIALVLLMATSLFAQGAQAVPAQEELTGVAKLAKEAEAYTHDQLVEKAMAETGDFVIYGNTSRIATAGEDFGKLYGINVLASNLKDQEIYTKLEIEIEGNAKDGADMVMIQDGANLRSQMTSTGNLVNFVPASVKDYVADADKNPLVQQYINKVIIWNNGTEMNISNVWQLTEPSMKGNVIFKSPEKEQVNMNFLIMLTTKEWSDKLADAYKAYFGKAIELGSYKNAGYKWIAEFLANVTYVNSDTTIAEEISQPTATGKVGLFVLSKLRSSSVLSDNLTVAEYEAEKNGSTVVPFSGFAYPMYAMVTSNASRPYTAMLFIEYLMQADGFKPWGKSIGAYSGNSSVPAKEGDLSLETWKKSLVLEDAEYILDNYEEVSSFIIKSL